ncbi:MAG: DUF3536 domain-containing protein [Anaerolineae bacterium]|nr:DUF3536 domain-containing protein [Anaerolineae bacterium]
MDRPLLCVHGHFYQPPREDPFTGTTREEPSAAPWANWNERITEECYAPNATVGNFERISFNLGGTLARWLDRESHVTYAGIVASDRRHQAQFGVGNAIAQSVHHTILPLARGRDKRCQIHWGIASFVHRFGHRPEGLWLPEMAVDHETLETVSQAGVKFVILSQEQVVGDLSRGAGPYKVSLAGGSFLSVFVRDRDLSNSLSFQMPSPQQSKEWAWSTVGRRDPGTLSLIATDGETFGHHYKQGVEVLRRITQHDAGAPYEMTTLSRFLRDAPPRSEVEIRDFSAWSCDHHLGRWVTGCSCTPECGHWKGALRRALDKLAWDLDTTYVDVLRRRDVAPWRLRDAYIHVLLGDTSPEAFLREHGLGDLGREARRRTLDLLEAQLYRQRMFVSCGFFFEELERIEPRYAIASAVQALALTYYATGDDLTRSFRRDLGVAISPCSGRSGADILDELLVEAQFGESRLGGAMALGRPMHKEAASDDFA